MQGIYMLVIDGEKYVGSSIDMEKRVASHIKAMEKGLATFKIQRAYDNGDKEVGFSVLKNVPLIRNLDLFEVYYIGLHDTISNGLNSNLTGRNARVSGRAVVYGRELTVINKVLTHYVSEFDRIKESLNLPILSETYDEAKEILDKLERGE